MKIELEIVREADKSVLRNLLELCSHDYSEFNQADVDAHGLYNYSYLDHYWTEPDRYAFFIKAGDKLAGFVMVRTLEDGTHSIAEFFVLRKYRHQGVGKVVAWRIFDRFPGPWSVEQEPGNLPAQRFWNKIIGEYTSGCYEKSLHERGGEQHPAQHFVARVKSE